MFTGLIADVGEIVELRRDGEGARLRIATTLTEGSAPGDSVAVDGVCLTARDVSPEGFCVDVVNQTLERSALGERSEGDRVNLELALRASDRLGGHIVQGHVDGTATLARVEPDGMSRRLTAGLEPELLRYVVERGSIALDGVSLTVAELADEELTVAVIPETLERTTLGAAEPGRMLNVELDVIARYVERLVSGFRDEDAR